MPRPKGTFNTPHKDAKLSETQRAKNHKAYLRRLERNAKRKKEAPNSYSRNQAQLDAKVIDYAIFPDSMFCEWLKTHEKTYGSLRMRTRRWGITNNRLGNFLRGWSELSAATLLAIKLDTDISMERLLEDFHEIRSRVPKETPDGGS